VPKGCFDPMNSAVSEILAKYGLAEKKISAVADARDQNGIWRVMFSHDVGDPVTLMDIGHAIQLSNELNDAGDLQLAVRILAAAHAARRHAMLPKK